MKQTITFNDFLYQFKRMERFDQFGHEGLSVLFDYLDEYENDTGEQIELDVIAFCCEYAHSTWDEIVDAYNIDVTDLRTEEDKRDAVREYLEENTFICGETDTGIVYAQF